MTAPRTLPRAGRSSPYRRAAARSRAEVSAYRDLDWVLIAAVLSMCVFGVLLVWSATHQAQIEAHRDPQAYLKRDLLNVAIGLALGVLVSRFDYRTLRAYAPVVYGASILGLFAVFAIGTSVHGAKAWIQIGGGFSLQPSEFTKVGIIVLLAMFLGEKRDIETAPRDTDVAVALALGAVPIGLILLQDDTGTALVLVAILLGVLTVSAARARWIVGLLLTMAIGAVLIIQLHLLHGYQMDRLRAFVDPTGGAASYGMNTQQARYAIGSGGLFGHGLFHGPLTNGGYVFASDTDFVFSVAGEELGFVGAGAIVVLAAIVMWRGLRIALRAPDMFGRLVATGVVCWFAFQSFENIGMNLGIMPVTGIPLMFISYGGSSMFANMIAVGLLQTVHRHTRASLPANRY